jgi:hypothetical protein
MLFSHLLEFACVEDVALLLRLVHFSSVDVHASQLILKSPDFINQLLCQLGMLRSTRLLRKLLHPTHIHSKLCILLSLLGAIHQGKGQSGDSREGMP